MKKIKSNDESNNDSIERLAEYYAYGEMTKKEFNEAKEQLTLENFKAVLDKCYSDMLSSNTLIAQERMRRAKRATGYAPIGYRNIIDENRNYNVIPDKENATFITQLFELFVTGVYTIDNLVTVARKFGLLGKISKKPISKKNIIYVLNNPFYCGFARYKDTLYEHKYERLISVDLFLKCQSLLIKRGII